MDCTGNNKDNDHSAKRDGIGDNEDSFHSVEENDIGNINYLRRSQRNRKQTEFYGYDAHCAFSAQQFVENDPISMADAKKRDDWPQWRNAVENEYSSLIKNDTWTLCELPSNRKVISCKWVFKLKRKANGDIDKYKARLVARGFTQEKGFDFSETYSPTAKLTTFRVLMSIANHFGYFIHQMDVKNAFLNGQLEEDIYMQQPEGFVQDKTKVCKLNKSLYGLKQAAKKWNERMDHAMDEIGFNRCSSDQCLYVRIDGEFICYILLYVDDLIFVSNDMQMIDKVKAKLKHKFDMTDVGEIDTFLGISVERDKKSGTLSMGQAQYLNGVLCKFNMENSKTITTPMEVGLNLPKDNLNEHCDVPYRELIGCLTYATITTRPDLMCINELF